MLLAENLTFSTLIEIWAPVIGFLITWGGFAWVYLKKRSRWARKNFTEQVNFSLNYIENGTLQLRTLLEDNALRVWLNEFGVKKVLAAADDTTVEHPFMRMDDPEDMRYLLRAALNVLSERFAEVFLARAMENAVPTRDFVFGITCEKYGGIQTQKVRVMLIRRQVLEEMFGERNLANALEVAEPTHRDRIATLREMHRLLNSSIDSERSMLGTIELGVIG